MSISTVDKELIRYFAQLDEPQKKSLLGMMKTFLRTAEDQIKPQSIKEYNQELNDAMERISRGEFTTIEQLEKEMQSW
jgi:DNA anti-recombination protein RmuC